MENPQSPARVIVYGYMICDCQGTEHTGGAVTYLDDEEGDDGSSTWEGQPLDSNCATWGYDRGDIDGAPTDDPNEVCAGNLPPDNGCVVDCPGDINGDLMVNSTDFLQHNSSDGNNCTCPADIDGDVDIVDFVIFNSNFGKDCTLPSPVFTVTPLNGYGLNMDLVHEIEAMEDLELAEGLRMKIGEWRTDMQTVFLPNPSDGRWVTY